MSWTEARGQRSQDWGLFDFLFFFSLWRDLVPTYVDTWKKWAFERMRRRLPWPKSRKSSGNWSLSSPLNCTDSSSLPTFIRCTQRTTNHRFLILSSKTSNWISLYFQRVSLTNYFWYQKAFLRSIKGPSKVYWRSIETTMFVLKDNSLCVIGFSYLKYLSLRFYQ